MPRSRIVFLSNLEIETAFGRKYLKFQASTEFEETKVFASTACCEIDNVAHEMNHEMTLSNSRCDWLIRSTLNYLNKRFCYNRCDWLTVITSSNKAMIGGIHDFSS